MKYSRYRDFLATAAAAAAVAAGSLASTAAQEPPPPPNDPAADNGGRPGAENQRGGGDGDKRDRDWRSRRSGRDDRGDMESLSDEEREALREAFRKVWERDDVRSAREQLGKAMEDYRAALRSAMEDVDPKLRPILERALDGPPRGFGGRGFPQDLASGDPVENTAQFFFHYAKDDEQRERMRKIAQRLKEMPKLRQAADVFRDTVKQKDLPRDRAVAAYQAFRSAVREAMIESEPALSEIIPEKFDFGRPPGDRREDGGPPPPGEGEGRPPQGDGGPPPPR